MKSKVDFGKERISKPMHTKGERSPTCLWRCMLGKKCNVIFCTIKLSCIHLRGREGEKETRKKSSHPFVHPQMLTIGQAKASHAECSSGLPCRWQTPTPITWATSCCLPVFALAGSWSLEPEPTLQPWYSYTECTLTAALNNCPLNFFIPCLWPFWSRLEGDHP